MNALIGFVNGPGSDEAGATAVEYSILLALIAMAIVIAVRAIGDSLGMFFGNLATQMQGW